MITIERTHSREWLKGLASIKPEPVSVDRGRAMLIGSDFC
jgi:hypothetical protein